MWKKNISEDKGRYDGKVCISYDCIFCAGNILLYLGVSIICCKAFVLTMLFYGILLAADYMSLVVMGIIFSRKIFGFFQCIYVLRKPDIQHCFGIWNNFLHQKNAWK